MQVAPATPGQAEAQLVSSVEDGELLSAGLIPEQEVLSQQPGVSSSEPQEPASREQLALVPYEPLVPRTFLYRCATDAAHHESAGALSSSFTGVVTASPVLSTLLEDSRYITVRNLITEPSSSAELEQMRLITLSQSDRLDFSCLNTLLHAVHSSDEVRENPPEDSVLHVALVTGRMTMLDHARTLWEEVVQFRQIVHEFSVQLHLFTMVLDVNPSRGTCCPQQGWTCEHVLHVFSQVVERFNYLTKVFSREIVAHPNHEPEQGEFNAREAFRRSQPRQSPQKATRQSMPADGVPPAVSLPSDSGGHLATTQDGDSVTSQVSTPDTETRLGSPLEQDVDSGYESHRLSTEAHPPSEQLRTDSTTARVGLTAPLSGVSEESPLAEQATQPGHLLWLQKHHRITKFKRLKLQQGPVAR
ncbi:hypothetical protein V5799_030568 [Amblyomma americanum]|uniref:Uncharacterized protein n=1 Tax=Amblyomma americanum TaxID=6943 RepID=A0AAQ4EN10_AMBAM